MERKNIIKTSLLTMVLLFNSCGGSSSGERTSLVPKNNSNDENNSINEDNNSTMKNPNAEAILKAQKEPYFKYAWHIDSHKSVLNSNDYFVDAHADINVTEAWKLSMGKGVKVAVIDDGAEVEHEDLKENIFLAYDADNGGNKINPNSEEGSHGNTCAGFIVAPINGKGIVGIAPQAKMISIAQKDESDEHVIKAFEYAKEHGAKVISCSWGSNNVSDILVSELKKLYDSGITVLFASGNDGTSLDEENINDESEVEWVIGVGASGENNDVTSYSNYGKKIEIIAPGGDTEESSGILGLDDMAEKGESNGLELVNENYTFTRGTSFSTPVTAGVVTLMYGVNPNITPAQVKEILIKTADKVGQDADADYSDKNFDIKRAYGKVNAGRAVVEAKALIK
jgi:subtilisin family serine protease